MKKILVRAGMNPWDIYSPDDVLTRNLIGNNSGNLIYAYGVFQTLETEKTQLNADYYQAAPTWADKMNRDYEAYVIPLADAFRKDFIPNLVQLTRLIKKLKIPCIVTGVGLRVPYEPDMKEKRPFDKEVKEFMKAVLNHSSLVGVRGEITGAYLKRLGFREEMDYRVIGCPSMYAHGMETKIQKPVLTDNSKISVNYSVLSPSKVIHLLNRILETRENSQMVAQRLNELKLLYLGTFYQHQQDKPEYPTSICSPVYQRKQVRFFINAIQWIENMKAMDLSIGGRMHGNIAAWLSGTPAVFFPHDGRMRELVEFHRLPSIPAHEVKGDMRLEEIIEKVDWQSGKLCQELNFRRYEDFLAMNGLESSFKAREIQKNGGNGPLKSKVKGENLRDESRTREEIANGISSVVELASLEEVAARWDNYERISLANKNKTIQELRRRIRLYEPSSLKKDAGRLALRLLGKI